jgi:hypothetical protein
MATQVALQQIQLDDFVAIRDLAPAKLEAAVDALRLAPSTPMKPDRLANVLAEGLKEPKGTADGIVRQALALYAWIIHGGLTISELQASTREAVKNDFGWTDAEIEKWRGVEPAFSELIASKAIRLTASVIDLSYEYTNIWQGARILTDIRPIFNEDATVIDGAVVSHAFRLRFDSVDGPHEMYVCLDESDIRALADQCERALQKSRTAGSMLTEKAKVPIVIPGEKENA